MKIKWLYHKTFCIMQWSIGFAENDLANIIRNKKTDIRFKWLPPLKNNVSIADPFLLEVSNDTIQVLYEDFSMVNVDNYGKIVLGLFDKKLNIILQKEILDSGLHSSYPLVFKENGKTYVLPESRKANQLCIYEYDFETKLLKNKVVLINNQPLLDSTLLKHNNKYWLFATMGDGVFDHSKLYIFYADSLLGPYIMHKNNPVKHGLNGTRPGGNFFIVDNELYRPAQNCKEYYGESLTINKIIKLDEDEFEEIPFMVLKGDKNSKFNAGLHTINVMNDVMVVDGIRMVFMPIKKIKNFIKSKIGK
jgi:hypothetical protein